MTKQKSWKRVLIGGVAATAVVASVAAFTLAPSSVSAQNAQPQAPAAQDGGRGFGQRDRGGPMGMENRGPKGPEQSEALADALGISVEELEAAQAAAHEAALAQLVAEGVITQEQADGMGQRTGRGGERGFAGPGRFGGEGSIDHDALLAAQLDGITATDVEEAREAVRAAHLEAAIAEGRVTEEQAANMETMHALRDYIDHEAMMAGALGVSVSELQEAHEDRTMRELIESTGMDRDAVHEAMQAGFEQAVQDAVNEDVITQAQADALEEGVGFGGRGFAPDHGGRGGHGGPGGFERGGNFQRGNGDGTGPRATFQGSQT